jgi:hypothetical protein
MVCFLLTEIPYLRKLPAVVGRLYFVFAIVGRTVLGRTILALCLLGSFCRSVAALSLALCLPTSKLLVLKG